MDHTAVDIILVDSKDRQPIGTPDKKHWGGVIERVLGTFMKIVHEHLEQN